MKVDDVAGLLNPEEMGRFGGGVAIGVGVVW